MVQRLQLLQEALAWKTEESRKCQFLVGHLLDPHYHRLVPRHEQAEAMYGTERSEPLPQNQ